MPSLLANLSNLISAAAKIVLPPEVEVVRRGDLHFVGTTCGGEFFIYRFYFQDRWLAVAAIWRDAEDPESAMTTRAACLLEREILRLEEA